MDLDVAEAGVVVVVVFCRPHGSATTSLDDCIRIVAIWVLDFMEVADIDSLPSANQKRTREKREKHCENKKKHQQQQQQQHHA